MGVLGFLFKSIIAGLNDNIAFSREFQVLCKPKI